jgi:hypothetical protein
MSTTRIHRSAFAKFSLAAASAVGLLASGAAQADVPPPDSTQCVGKAAGDGCTTDMGSEGSCQTATCSKLDYSNGTPPTSVDYECLLCEERTGTDGTDVPGTDGTDGTDLPGTDGTDLPGTDGTGTDGSGTDVPGTDGGTDVPGTDGTGTGSPPVTTTGGDTKDSTASKSSSSKSSGCSAVQVAGGVGPAMLALVGAYFLARRRSRG